MHHARHAWACTLVSVLCPLDGLDVHPLLHHLPQRAHLTQLVHVGHLWQSKAKAAKRFSARNMTFERSLGRILQKPHWHMSQKPGHS